MNKEKLLKKMEEARFAPITNDLFKVYDEFEAMCNPREDVGYLMQLYFYKGETYFRRGEYQSAEQYLSKCLLLESEDSSPDVLANCHNVLGLIYVSMGYELLAMEHYLLSSDYADACNNARIKVINIINIGWMYRDLGDRKTALECFDKAIEVIQSVEVDGAYDLWELCFSYIGQISFLMGNYDQGLEAMGQIKTLTQETDILYDVVAQNMKIRGYAYLKDEEHLKESIENAISNAAGEEDFLECCEAYFDICRFLIDSDELYALKMLKVLRIHCDKINLPFLNLKMKSLDVLYAKKYMDRTSYLEECALYYEAHKNFNTYDNEYKVQNLASIKALQEERKEKLFYKEKSRYDQMTGLLNKTAFTNAVVNMMASIDFSNHACALAIIDIDLFKQINDNYGHSSGDRFIIDTASMLKNAFNSGTLIGRIGGDEFCVFWPNGSDEQLVVKQVDNLHELFKHRRRSTDISKNNASVSVGIAFAKDDIKFTELFEKADQALYQSKENGRNQTTIYK